MKAKVMIVLGLFIQLFVMGQEKSQYECLYEYKVKTPNNEVETYSTILQIGDNIASFKDYAAFRLDSLIQAKASDTQIQEAENQLSKAAYFFDQTVYQNQPKGKLSVYSTITPNYYTYQEDKNTIVWKLGNQTKAICGYVCKEATAEYGGRTWTAWYTTDIPLSFGPWKFVGLPGLVLAISDSEGIHRFEAIQFHQSNSVIIPAQYPNVLEITKDKFIKAKNNFEENPLANLQKEGITDMEIKKRDGGKKSIFVNGMQLRLRLNGYVPLEIK